MYEVKMSGILARELADTIAEQLRIGLPDGMKVVVLSNAPHADDLDLEGRCVKEGCVLHSHEDEDDGAPTGGDGDPSFPGGIGCMGHYEQAGPGGDFQDHVPCDTLWATSVSLQAHKLATGHGDPS